MRKAIVITAFGLAVLYSCKHEVETTTVNPGGGTGVDTTLNTGGGTGGTPATTAICFEADVLPIFRSNCAKSGCHDVASHQDDYIFDSYSNIVKKDLKPGKAEDSKIYKMITETDVNKRMPPPPNAPLSAAQIDLIKRWINEGAVNTTNCATTCDASVFTYAAAVKPIIDANCVGCHNGAAAPLGINLTTYAGLKTVALDGRLSGAINHQPGFTPMPMNAPKLSDCKISQITKWIQAGSPNN